MLQSNLHYENAFLESKHLFVLFSIQLVFSLIASVGELLRNFNSMAKYKQNILNDTFCRRVLAKPYLSMKVR